VDELEPPKHGNIENLETLESIFDLVSSIKTRLIYNLFLTLT